MVPEARIDLAVAPMILGQRWRHPAAAVMWTQALEGEPKKQAQQTVRGYWFHSSSLAEPKVLPTRLMSLTQEKGRFPLSTEEAQATILEQALRLV